MHELHVYKYKYKKMVRFLCLQMGNFVVKCSNGLQDYSIVKTVQIAKRNAKIQQRTIFNSLNRKT